MSLRKSAAALVLTTDGARERADGWHRRDDLVRWGSISKVFTAGLAHVAVSEKRLGWNTTVDEILGGGCDATVSDLVNHRSGLPRVLPAQQRQIVDPYRSWDRDRSTSRSGATS